MNNLRVWINIREDKFNWHNSFIFFIVSDETDKAKPTEEFAVNNLGLSSGDTTQQSDIKVVGSPATSPNNDSNSFSLSSGGFVPNSVQSTVTSPVTDELSFPVTDTDNISDPQGERKIKVLTPLIGL